MAGAVLPFVVVAIFLAVFGISGIDRQFVRFQGTDEQARMMTSAEDNRAYV